MGMDLEKYWPAVARYNAEFTVTFFPDKYAATKTVESMTLNELRNRIESTNKPNKEALPFQKLATFGDRRSENNCLRHDLNVVSINGIEGDYDAEQMTLDAAVAIAQKAKLYALLYTSASYSDATPRWRILVPTSRPLPPSERTKLMARVNGLYGGMLASESFTLSQSYYFGSVGNNPLHRAVVVYGDEYIDLRDDLDATAILPASKANGSGEHIPNLELEATYREEAAAALAVIPNDEKFDSWQAWNDVAMATWGATRGSDVGWRAFDEWSKKHPSYNAKDTRERWEAISRSPPDRIGFGRLVYLADQADPDWRDKFNAERQQEGAQQAAGIGFGTQPQPKDPAWPTMRQEAYHGIAGQLVAAIEPHSESDPVATLIQFLTCFGNSVGRTKFYLAEATPHHTNLFVTLVGISSKGRKGTSFGHIRPVMTFCDGDWVTNNLRDDGGLSSGEGLINVVRDPVEKWDPKEQQHYLADPGVEDKRLMLVEGEFAGLLSVMERPGNTISPLIRKAWDDGNLSTLTRQSPLKATGAHISIIGHITNDELRARLTRTEMGNGFANRFLFMLVRRSKELPFGGNVDAAEIRRIGWSLCSIRVYAQECSGRINFSPDAAQLWEAEYHDLSTAHSGLLGSITARSEAQTVRLALVYALLDKSDVIDVPHLRAALAVQQYAFDSAGYIFGQSLGDETADTILQALKNHPEGMTRTAISNLFSNHKERDKIRVALALLLGKGLARMKLVKTGGAPAEVWFAT
jgi:Protein of unknown function (DUF3987)/Primase C terminal 2 (PriCT-2)